MEVPTPNGTLEIKDAAGRCIIEGCRVRGGGLVSVQEVTPDVMKLPGLAWEGKRIVICGGHLVDVLATVLHLADEDGRLRGEG